jgi:hypothetical protein
MPVSRWKILLLLSVTLVFAAGCSRNVTLYKQAVKEYNQGDFETSLQTGTHSLELKPGYQKAQNLVKKTYNKVIADREERIRQLEQSLREDMWDQLTLEYKAMLDLQVSLQPINPLYNKKTRESFTFGMQDYAAKFAESKTGAAEAHYQRGVALTEISDDPDIQKEAVREFKKALSYNPNYKDAASRYEKARQFSITRVAVLSFEDKSGARKEYGGLIDLLTESIIAKMVQDKVISASIEVVTRDQLAALFAEQHLNSPTAADTSGTAVIGNILDVHQILTGKLIQINYIEPRTTSTDLKETKNIVLGTEKYTDTHGKTKSREVKGDVICNYKRFTKTASVKIIASFNLLDVQTGKVKHPDTVNSEISWTDTWARVTGGDERALSDLSQSLITKDEPFPPSETDMVNTALEELSAKIVDSIREYLQ